MAAAEGTGARTEATTGFDGAAGRVAASVMARLNRDMEEAALDLLVPRHGQRILVIGFGAGVGIEMLLARCEPASVTGIDPSTVMMAATRRRLARDLVRHQASARVTLIATTLDALALDSLAPGEYPFDAAVAVNSHQLWQPHDVSAGVLASVLERGGRLVTVTHDWAIEKRLPLEQWHERVAADLKAAGFAEPTWDRRRYRSGSGTSLITTREDRPTV